MFCVTYDNKVFSTIKDFYRHVKGKYDVNVSYNFVYAALKYRGLSSEEAVQEIVNRDDTVITYGRKKFNNVKSLYKFLNRFDKVNVSYVVFIKDYSILSREEFKKKYNLYRQLKAKDIDTIENVNFVKTLKCNRFITTKLSSQEFLKNL